MRALNERKKNAACHGNDESQGHQEKLERTFRTYPEETTFRTNDPRHNAQAQYEPGIGDDNHHSITHSILTGTGLRTVDEHKHAEINKRCHPDQNITNDFHDLILI